jgi:phage replication O-like protein O
MFSPPNYTQTPNEFFDSILPNLNLAQTKVLLVIIRQTFGWQKRWDCISLTQMMKKTGLAKSSITKAVNELIEMKLVMKHKNGEAGREQTYYTLCVADTPPDPSDEDEFSNNSYRSNSLTPPSPKFGLTKETITKEIRENLPKGRKKSTRKIPRAPHISTTQEEHEKLLQDFGEQRVQEAYKHLSEWKEDVPKTRWRKSDYLAIRRWVMDALKKKGIKPKMHDPKEIENLKKENEERRRKWREMNASKDS